MKKISFSLALFSVLLPIYLLSAHPANAVPATAWRTRRTSLVNREQCIQRAFDAMEQAGLNNIRTSGTDNMAVYGQSEQTNSTIVCENGGSLAAIFCSSYNRHENLNVCDYIAAYMQQ